MSYGDDLGDDQAVKMLSSSRERAHETVQKVNSFRGQAGDAPIVPVEETPTKLSQATAAVEGYVQLLRPFRTKSEVWNRPIGTLDLPKEETEEAAGRSSAEVATYRPTGPLEYELQNLTDFLNVADMVVTYARSEQSRSAKSRGLYTGLTTSKADETIGEDVELDHDDIRRYQLVFDGATLQMVVERADDVLQEIGLLPEGREDSTTGRSNPV